MRDTEQRHITGAVELRASDNGPGVIVGYASVFNRLSQNLGGFVERVDPDAFNKSLADGVPVVARFNHKDDFLLGTTESPQRLGPEGMGAGGDLLSPQPRQHQLQVAAEAADGRFELFALPPGRLRILVESQDHALAESRGAAIRDRSRSAGTNGLFSVFNVRDSVHGRSAKPRGTGVSHPAVVDESERPFHHRRGG